MIPSVSALFRGCISGIFGFKRVGQTFREIDRGAPSPEKEMQMKYLNLILKKLFVLNASNFETYILEKEFSVPTIRKSYRG